MRSVCIAEVQSLSTMYKYCVLHNNAYAANLFVGSNGNS